MVRTQHQQRNQQQRRKLAARSAGTVVVPKTIFQSTLKLMDKLDAAGRQLYRKMTARRGSARST